MANRKKRVTLFPIAYSSRRNLFYRAVASQVSLAKMSLTSVFGMGTGGTSSQSSPTVLRTTASKLNNEVVLKHNLQGQALDRLVLAGLIHHCTYTLSLST